MEDVKVIISLEEYNRLTKVDLESKKNIKTTPTDFEIKLENSRIEFERRFGRKKIPVRSRFPKDFLMKYEFILSSQGYTSIEDFKYLVSTPENIFHNKLAIKNLLNSISDEVDFFVDEDEGNHIIVDIFQKDTLNYAACFLLNKEIIDYFKRIEN